MDALLRVPAWPAGARSRVTGAVMSMKGQSQRAPVTRERDLTGRAGARPLPYFSSAACAAARRATGTLKGLQLT